MLVNDTLSKPTIIINSTIHLFIRLTPFTLIIHFFFKVGLTLSTVYPFLFTVLFFFQEFHGKSYMYRYTLTYLVDPEIVWVPKYFLLVGFSAAIVNAGAKQEKTNATIKATINLLYIFDILPLLLCCIKLILSCFLSKSC